eukprot:GEMP01037521.1.p1 GENE.GEMP01037521.1~~GEMP01037521.1.p1  ORF type:complete len:308 (+),score=73.89 GEMP01037521.1:68-991(+)
MMNNLGHVMSPGTQSTLSRASYSGPHRSTNDAMRSKKLVESNARTLQNRIAYFKREEEKIWRDLEEVRRQTGKIEEGRTRATEKKLADHAILKQREHSYYQKRLSAAEQKNFRDATSRQQQNEVTSFKKACGVGRRLEAQEMMQQKRMSHDQTRLRNSQRAMLVQRAQLDAKMRINHERQERLSSMREETVKARISATKEVESIEAIIPQLEQEEMACLQRLQNSRIVTQNVLQELEASLGHKTSVSSVMRLRGTTLRNSFLPPERSMVSIAQQLHNEEADENGVDTAHNEHQENGGPRSPGRYSDE